MQGTEEFGRYSDHFVVDEECKVIGKKVYVPGAYSHLTETKNVANIGKYRVCVLRVWGGNGFGHTSTRYVLNSETGVVFRHTSRMYDTLAYLKDTIKRVEAGDK